MFKFHLFGNNPTEVIFLKNNDYKLSAGMVIMLVFIFAVLSFATS
jgi:hypothetical protein